VGDTAKILYQLYIGLSLLLTLCLLLCGLSLYDALLHTFSTAGTGGFPATPPASATTTAPPWMSSSVFS
jgi:Trk-type K+ transport system membrane component